MFNNLGTPSSELQINFGVLQIGTENSITGRLHKLTPRHPQLCEVCAQLSEKHFQKLLKYLECTYLINPYFSDKIIFSGGGGE